MNSEQFFDEILPQIAGGPIRMKDSGSAHCACPGSEQHTAPTACNHTTAFWNEGRPRIHCFHSSCQPEVEAANHALREYHCWGSTSGKKGNGTAMTFKEKLRAHAEQSRDWIFEEHRWPYSEIQNDSPYEIDDIPAIQTILHLSLFEPKDTIWIGQLKQTGMPKNVWNFRVRDEWLDRVGCLPEFICPSVFNPGSWSRCERNVAASKFLVVESDVLSKDQVGAVFRFLKQRLTLRAVVDTGGKSLHAWFDRPADDSLAQLKIILPELGCDPKMFGASQPCRLAGRKRDNSRWQRLVYLNPEVSLEN